MRAKIDMVKGALEIVYLGALITFIVYMSQPDLRTRHAEYLKCKQNALKNWLEVQQTLESIRNLPETRNSSSA